MIQLEKITTKTIGIWGYGVVGQAATQYLLDAQCSIAICDKRSPTDQERTYIVQHNIHWYSQRSIAIFLEKCDIIIPSPGINLQSYLQYKHKFLSELDFFSYAWHKPIIGITGTAGKTTVTNLLAAIFKKAHIPVAIGGNIGTGMLALIKQQKDTSYALLELSSWQLELNTTCAPHIAIWTNFAANHLDRHDTLENYFNAKYRITALQSENDYTIAPLELMEQLYTRLPRSRCIFFYEGIPPQKNMAQLKKQDMLFYYHHNSLHLASLCDTKQSRQLWSTTSLPNYSFTQNWLAVMAAMYILDIPFDLILSIDLSLCTQSHRLEKVVEQNGVTFYNDSKSTTIISTKASLQKFIHKRIHLFLGGLSKGINREPLIKEISQNKNIIIYCFGIESYELYKLCQAYNVQSYTYITVQECLNLCIKNCLYNDIVLFSPAGSSFDQFKDYQDRGNKFKAALAHLIGDL